METDIVQAVARYAEEMMGPEGFRYVSAVVANCKMLALELEALEENPVTLDLDALVIAAYLHDISTVRHGYQNHHVKSAQMAVEFLDLLSADHHAMDDAFYARLGEVFTAAQIVELGFTCAQTMGLHRFLHTLDIYGTDPPVIAYSPDQVDAAKEPTTA